MMVEVEELEAVQSCMVEQRSQQTPLGGDLGLRSGGLMSRLPHFRRLGRVSENAEHPAAHVGVDFHQPHLVRQAMGDYGVKLRYEFRHLPFK